MTKEEAIKIVKEFINGTCLHLVDQEALETLIPELRESEDERIRKAIREILLDAPAQDLINKDLELEKALAWLEKQKEQKPISAEEVLVKAGLKPYKDGNQWCILAGDNIQEGICGFGDTIEDALYEFLKEVLDLQKKQKPAEWSEKDEDMRNLLIKVLEVNHRNGYFKANEINTIDMRAVYTEELVAWLKSLRPQSKVILKEKDAWCCSVVWACVRDSEEYTKEEKEYIKKFLYRCNPVSQPHWKPSEEQMTMLLRAEGVVRVHDTKELAAAIAQLYEQLKKLM